MLTSKSYGGATTRKPGRSVVWPALEINRKRSGRVGSLGRDRVATCCYWSFSLTLPSQALASPSKVASNWRCPRGRLMSALALPRRCQTLPSAGVDGECPGRLGKSLWGRR